MTTSAAPVWCVAFIPHDHFGPLEGWSSIAKYGIVAFQKEVSGLARHKYLLLVDMPTILVDLEHVSAPEQYKKPDRAPPVTSDYESDSGKMTFLGADVDCHPAPEISISSGLSSPSQGNFPEDQRPRKVHQSEPGS